MGRVSLPEGVAPTNEKSAHGDARFAVPDTAIPDFAISETRTTPPAAMQAEPPQLKSRRFYRFEEDDEDDEEEDKRRKKDPVQIAHGAHAPGPVAILVAIGLVLAALAAFVIARNQPGSLPLCSEQPDWNQYNCRPG